MNRDSIVSGLEEAAIFELGLPAIAFTRVGCSTLVARAIIIILAAATTVARAFLRITVFFR